MVSLGGKTFYSRCICRAGFTTVGGGAPPNFGFSGPPPPTFSQEMGQLTLGEGGNFED